MRAGHAATPSADGVPAVPPTLFDDTADDSADAPDGPLATEAQPTAPPEEAPRP
jgi:hypothetical protein